MPQVLTMMAWRYAWLATSGSSIDFIPGSTCSPGEPFIGFRVAECQWHELAALGAAQVRQLSRGKATVPTPRYARGILTDAVL
jgi:hypothetical protein